MANEQHVEWLKEGVKAWNKRRVEEPFIPDLEGADLRGADLSGFDLSQAILQKAELESAILSKADLRLANLTRAYLRFAVLKGAKVHNSVFFDADFRTEAQLKNREEEISTKNIYRVSLEGVEGLEQQQINTMLGTKGEFGTVLPTQLSVPKRWDDSPIVFIHQATQGLFKTEVGDIRFSNTSKLHIFPKDEDENGRNPNSGLSEQDETAGYLKAVQRQQETMSPIAQATFILKTANASKNSASMAATQTDEFIQQFIAENGRPNESPEIDFLEGLKTTFQQFETTLSKSATDDARIQELEALLEAKDKEIENLTKLLANKPGTFQTILENAAGAVLGVGIVTAASSLYGATAPDLINILNDLLTNPPSPTPQTKITEV